MNQIKSLLRITKIIGISLLFILSLLSGCSLFETVEKKPTLSLAPVDIFEGANSKFKPFLGDFSGGVTLDYSGEKKNIEIFWEIWENGNRTFTPSKISDVFFQYEEGEVIKDYKKELIVSVRSIQIQDGEFYEIVTSLVDDSGSSTSSSMLDKEEKYKAFSFQTIHEPITINMDEETSVMGLYASSSGSLETYGTFDEAKQKAEWLLVVSITVKD